jgi:hypothetical protein
MCWIWSKHEIKDRYKRSKIINPKATKQDRVSLHDFFRVSTCLFSTFSTRMPKWFQWWTSKTFLLQKASYFFVFSDGYAFSQEEHGVMTQVM